jgi:hypothetical protein
MPAGIARDLHMGGDVADHVPRPDDIPGDPVRMIGVELQPHIRRADLGQNLQRKAIVGKVVARHVHPVDRLDHDALLRQRRRRVAQVGHKGRPRRLSLGHARHQVQMPRPQRPGIARRAPQVVAEPLLSARHGGKSPLSARIIRRRPVDDDQRHPMPRDLGRQGGRVDIIGELDFHRLEPGGLGSADPFDHRPFAEHHAQVSADLRHWAPLGSSRPAG